MDDYAGDPGFLISVINLQYYTFSTFTNTKSYNFHR